MGERSKEDDEGDISFDEFMQRSGVRSVVQDNRRRRPDSDQSPELHPSRERFDQPVQTKPTSSPVHYSTKDGRTLGARQGVNKKFLRTLRRGGFPVDRRLDLHGQRLQAARDSVHKAIQESWERGDRLVLIIHGKGLNSAQGAGVLRKALPSWLCAPEVEAMVLAFSSAAPKDGGNGATYVYLRTRFTNEH